MSLTFAKKVNILLQKISDVYEVTTIDDELLSYKNRIVNHEIKDIRL